MGAQVIWREVEPGRIIPIAIENGQEIDCAFSPLPGSQTAFLNCPVFETLYSGNRGNGKTDALLADFAQEVGKGYGRAWRGVLFRRTYKELEDVISKSVALYKRVFAGKAKYNKSSHVWTWDTGEELMLRYFRVPDDYWNYHGHAYPWIGWEELTTWPDDIGYKSMFSCVRSTVPGLPTRVRATTNPYGIGHNWVKLRFRLPMRPFPNFMGKHIVDDVDDEGRPLPPRFSIQGHLSENFVLTRADPDYITRIGAAARNEAQAKAWIDGSWDIVAGGMFDAHWNPKVHTIPRFDIPHRWKIDRSYDYGSSAPFAIIWTAEANGEDYRDHEGNWRSSVKGDLFIINEWYGWKKGKPNVGIGLTMAATATGIIQRELKWNLYGKVKDGPADSSIYDEEDGTSLALSMAKPVRINGKQYKGITWVKADKRPGSRKMGWKVIDERLENSVPVPGAIREKPGLFIFDHCEQWIRTVPTLPRDEKDMDDVDCFVAGTMISTPEGDIPIEQIKPGMLVNTPIGPQRARHVITQRPSHVIRVSLSNGEVLEGTPDHKIMVDNIGLVPLVDLKCGQALLQRTMCQNSLFIRELNTGNMKVDVITSPAWQTSEVEQRRFIDKSISIISGLSPTVFMSTIKTVIWKITSRLILIYFQPVSTLGTTLKPGAVDSSAENGGKLKPDKRCNEKTLKRCMTAPQNENFRAAIVEQLLSQNIHLKNIALIAQRRTTQRGGLQNLAQFAEWIFSTKPTQRNRSKPVVANVAGCLEGKTTYNLSVERAGMFFANGILSSNTDSEDHCFTGDTEIWTMTAVKKIVDLKPDDLVQVSKGLFAPFENLKMYRANSPTIELIFVGGSTVKCTQDHEFLTRSGWVTAQTLSSSVTPFLMNGCGSRDLMLLGSRPGKNEDVWCITVPNHGHFVLANGIIAKNCGDVTRYRVVRSGAVISSGRTTGQY